MLTELSKDNPISIENKLHEKKSDDLLIELEDEYRRVQVFNGLIFWRNQQWFRGSKKFVNENNKFRRCHKKEQRQDQITKRTSLQIDPEGFQEQLVPLKDDIENRQKDVKNFSDKSEALTNQLSLHRKEYQVLVAKLDEGKRRFQSLTGRSASLKARFSRESVGQTNEKEK